MIRQDLFDKEVELAVSERKDGNMRFFGDGIEATIIKNQIRLSESLNLSAEKTARIRTIYDGREDFTSYDVISDENIAKYSIINPEEQIPVSDGLVVLKSENGILLPLADCLGAVVFGRKRRILGLLHAGRQNVEQSGPKRFVELFAGRFGSDAKDLKVYFPPYAVDYRIYKMDNKKLGVAVREQLLSAGVLPENIIDSRHDTVSDKNLPSNSHGDTFDRFAVVVKLK